MQELQKYYINFIHVQSWYTKTRNIKINNQRMQMTITSNMYCHTAWHIASNIQLEDGTHHVIHNKHIKNFSNNFIFVEIMNVFLMRIGESACMSLFILLIYIYITLWEIRPVYIKWNKIAKNSVTISSLAKKLYTQNVELCWNKTPLFIVK